jgi:hypothetical protein
MKLPNKAPEIINRLAADIGGKVKEVGGTDRIEPAKTDASETRAQIIEECARVCDSRSLHQRGIDDREAREATECAKDIRALQPNGGHK